MIKKISLLALLVISVITFAQNDDAIKLLKNYGFTSSNVLNVLDLSTSPYSFKSRSTTHTFSKESNTDFTSVQEYTYNVSKELGQRFLLTSNDGKTPSKSDIKHFNKSKSGSSKVKKTILKDEDFFVKSDNDKILVIGFNMPKEELPSKIAYMAHLTGYIYIDKSTSKVTRIEFSSNEAFSMKIFHVNKMVITIDVLYNDEKKIYYLTKEHTNADILMFGAITKSEITEEFSDFKF